MAALSLYLMLPSFRFRILRIDSVTQVAAVGAYTLVRASSQTEALTALLQQLPPWETAAPLHGPNTCAQWF